MKLDHIAIHRLTDKSDKLDIPEFLRKDVGFELQIDWDNGSHSSLTFRKGQDVSYIAQQLINHACRLEHFNIERAYLDRLKRDVKVEQALLDVASGKSSLPTDREQFRKWAYEMGVPNK